MLAIAVFVVALPTVSLMAATEEYYNRVVDVNTMDNWQKYFDLNNLDTSNAGGVWTDKSVFKDASAFDGKITMLDGDKNFLTALSALAANKEIVGYSTVPTDTVLVLDASGSMSGSQASLVTAANNAIKQLLAVNENNRIGVVLYSASTEQGTSTYKESVTQLLPINRYTTARDGRYIYLDDTTVKVDGDTRGAGSNQQIRTTKTFGGGTYMQAGIWEAYKMFTSMDTVISDNNWQSGDNRMPIMVLMTDGKPTTGTTYFDDVENSQYTRNYGIFNQNQETVIESNVGDGMDENVTAGQAFLTQLTASYAMNRIEAHYKAENQPARGLFYTLGFNIGNDNIARSVMEPDSSTITDALWKTYTDLESGTMAVNVRGRNGNNTDVTISKNSYAIGKSYVDEYFSASGDGLETAFQSIVDEIIIQSRYYPTHLEGGSPDFSGYIEFTDTIGEYMEVKDVKGILLGSTLFNGHMMASKLTDTTEGGLGTVENPTDLGDEFIRAVKTRLGIAETADAQALVAKAFAAGQLRYNSATDWSNYIGWYAKADGTYAGFYDEGNTVAPSDAVYINKSYGFLGETTGSIKNSDMMYMSVQIHQNIRTGQQTVIWKIPAALVPMITYSVTLTGTNVEHAEDVEISVEDAQNVAPIRLIFESGLRSDLNELNITRITDSKHIATDGVTRQFWTNWFDISSPSHDQHQVTLAEFTPSLENERFYYTFDSAVHKKVTSAGVESYVLVPEGETLNENGEYYHRRYIFKEGYDTPQFFYEKMSQQSIKAAKWKSDFETFDGDVGAYVVPKGTPARELTMYDEQKSETDGIDTRSAHMVFHPYITEYNNISYVDMNLGNNGLLEITPAQGIKLSKTVDVFETGTNDEFSFRITVHNQNGTPYTGKLNSWITDLDVVPTGAATEITLSANGIYTVDLTRNQTLWLTGIPTGSTYTVEEISNNSDYKIKSVHVNGVSMGTVAAGTVAAYFIDDVDFVNTAVGEGDLVITKQVMDGAGNIVDVNDNLRFTATVTLKDAGGNPVTGTFPSTAGQTTVDANGRFTITLGDGQSFVIRNIPEETEYTVAETNIPAGFALNNLRSSLTGVVDASANDNAVIVNTYNPLPTNGNDVDVVVNKSISGNRTDWMNGESYTFTLERVEVTRDANTLLATKTISYSDSNKTALFDLSGESYTAPGTYYYRISEVQGTQGGITYDTAERRFKVVVADGDMDGDLEIISVENELNTTVSGQYTVTANYNNIYAPQGSATAVINVEKRMNGNHPLEGYQFALYDKDPSANADANEVVRSTLTNSAGQAQFTLNYAGNIATMQGTVRNYWMQEINLGAPNISYDTTVYPVKVTITDNGDGTVSADVVVENIPQGEINPVFTNTYVPSASDFVTIVGTKHIIGDCPLNDGEFAFTIESTTAGAPMPAVTTVRNNADGSFAFPAIEFGDSHKGRTFVYTVKEDGSSPIGGFTYDDTVYTVEVTVTDNGDGTLTATTVIKTGTPAATVTDISFANEYLAAPDKIVLTGTKHLVGKKLQNGEFSFKLTPITAGAPMPVNAIVTNDADGNISFGEIEFTKKGVYRYTLAEQSTNDSRYDFDLSVYTVEVTVTDNSTGRLIATAALTKNGLPATAVVFTNGFTPTPIAYDIHNTVDNFGGNKDLQGRPLEAGEFEFVLINAVNGQQIGDSVKNDDVGEFRFPEVVIPEAGIYHYKIVEVLGIEKGVTYDTSSFHIRLEVVKRDDGTLEIADKKLYKGTVTKQEVGGVLTEVTNYENITGQGQITFVNTYDVDPTYVVLEAIKTLTGRDLIDGEFKFDLIDLDNNNTVIQDNVVLSLQSDGTGKIAFMPIKIDNAGTYNYRIIEDEIDGEGVTVDTTKYDVTVEVVDNHKGDLVATVKVGGTAITGSTASTVVFNNTYSAAGTEVTLEAIKTLIGRQLIDGEFKFDLYSADENFVKGSVLQNDVKLKLQPDNTGRITFEPITYDTAGNNYYVIIEDETDKFGVTSDKTEYKVKVEITDNGLGQLVATVYVNGIEVEDDIATAIGFENRYKAAAKEILINGTKTLTGRDLAEGEFSFELYDEQGNKLSTVKNTADGKIIFPAMEVTEAGEYIYTVREVKGEAEGITYDSRVYTVAVEVTDNGKGEFIIGYTYADNSGKEYEKAEFANSYTAPVQIPDIPKTGDTTDLTLWIALLFVSGGIFAGANLLGKRKSEEK